MRVTVMSPVTADVSVAQAERWLSDRGWVRSSQPWLITMNAWICGTTRVVIADSDDPGGGSRMTSAIASIARAMNETPAVILQEMALTKL